MDVRTTQPHPWLCGVGVGVVWRAVLCCAVLCYAMLSYLPVLCCAGNAQVGIHASLPAAWLRFAEGGAAEKAMEDFVKIPLLGSFPTLKLVQVRIDPHHAPCTTPLACHITHPRALLRTAGCSMLVAVRGVTGCLPVRCWRKPVRCTECTDYWVCHRLVLVVTLPALLMLRALYPCGGTARCMAVCACVRVCVCACVVDDERGHKDGGRHRRHS